MSTPAAVSGALSEAVVAAIIAAGTPAGGSVYTPPLPKAAGFPRVTVDGYTEDERNFFGRPGSRFRCLVRGAVHVPETESGDARREALWSGVYGALHQTALTVDGHLHLYGRLRRIASYAEPTDARILVFVARYEAETRVSA